MDEDIPLEVVPNGVDPDYFSPQGGARKPARLVFSGKMSYAPNVEAVLWFARYVLPDLRETYPELGVTIVGSDPPAEVTQLARHSGRIGDRICGRYSLTPGLMCGISLAPMRTGVGVQNKVMEAMSMALPVVATSLAARAFGANCPGIVEADSAEDFVEQVSRLLGSPAQAAEIGLRGRQEVIARFSWQTSVNTLEAVYEDALRTFRSGRQIVKDTKECAAQKQNVIANMKQTRKLLSLNRFSRMKLDTRNLLIAGAVVVIALLTTGLYYKLCYVGLKSRDAIDMAQIAANMSEGHGFTTRLVRPSNVVYFQDPGRFYPELNHGHSIRLCVALIFRARTISEQAVSGHPSHSSC